MNYDELIEAITPIFQENGFKNIESDKNFSIFESNGLGFWVTFNKRENQFSISIVKDGYTITEMSDKLYKGFFNQSFDRDKTYAEKFIIFLEDPGNLLLKGDLIELKKLEKYSAEQDRIYTDQFVKKK